MVGKWKRRKISGIHIRHSQNTRVVSRQPFVVTRNTAVSSKEHCSFSSDLTWSGSSLELLGPCLKTVNDILPIMGWLLHSVE